jgi:ankyrin repeat protein
LRNHFQALIAACLFAEVLTAQTPTGIDFGRDIQPIFKEHCIGCHGPSQQMAGLRLDRRRDAMNIAGRRVIFPGESTSSRLYLRLSGNQLGLQMPPTGALSGDQINLIKRWIDGGAEWPDELAGETPRTRPDPRAVRMMTALRNGDRPAFRKLLREDRLAINLKGSGGSSPLMYAALYGDANSVRLLLQNGADPNLRNDAGATALMWAVDDLARVQLLIERGADANARSEDGRTPLIAAASHTGSSPVLKLLLDHGAKLAEAGPRGASLLTIAAGTGDEAVLRTLIDHGAEVKSARLALTMSVRAGCARCVDALAASAGEDDLNAALAEAAQRGDQRIVKMLLDRGAGVNANLNTAPQRLARFTVLMAAAFSELIPTETVKILIDRGAGVNITTENGETALDFASRHGNTPVVDLLRRAGGQNSAEVPSTIPVAKPAGSIRAAVERSIPLLQRSDVTFIRKSGCVSCHNNSLTAMTVAAVRQQGLPVDDETAGKQLRTVASYIDSWRERVIQGEAIPGQWNTIGYILAGMAAQNYPPDAATDALTRFLKATQLADGRWWNFDGRLRPPVDSSDIQVTAFALRGLQAYAPPPLRAEYAKSVRLATVWLARAEPRTTEDRAFQLLGLTWGERNRAAIRKAAQELLVEQRADGGWAQIPSLASDAYGTGQALVALKQCGALAIDSPAYKRGIRWLLNTQLEDGSWYVKSRSIPIMPYFESDFPHGRDQFISAAATNWAAMALAPAVR